MQVESRVPSNEAKRREADARAAAVRQAERVAARAAAVEARAHYRAAGERAAASPAPPLGAGEAAVAGQPRVLFVVRLKGLNKVPPKERKILQLLRLRQVHAGVFVRASRATLNMLRRVEPYVTYGAPTRAAVARLLYKRGFARVRGQRVPLADNRVVEAGLGAVGVRCIEELIQELYECGPNFQRANAFLWPFKLDSPRGGLRAKRHQFLAGGDQGPRDELINPLIHAML